MNLPEPIPDKLVEARQELEEVNEARKNEIVRRFYGCSSRTRLRGSCTQVKRLVLGKETEDSSHCWPEKITAQQLNHS